MCCAFRRTRLRAGAPGAARGAARARGTAQLRGCGSAADRGGRATPHAPRGRGVRRGNAPPPPRARAPSPDTRRAGPRKSAAGETGSLFGIVILVRLLYIRGSSGHYTHTRVEGTGAVATRTRCPTPTHTPPHRAQPPTLVVAHRHATVGTHMDTTCRGKDDGRSQNVQRSPTRATHVR
jgi:hypothetical protein